jgi:alkanesulfonate monooxygenase SsuD/methylene tetrahydromethanopterin reductase-like flavin-dependent oxidoreductase (luciferase family)
VEETLDYLERAFGGGESFTGRYYELDAQVGPKPAGIRIIVGGSGPRRTPMLAAAHADEYNHFVAPADDIAPKVALLHSTARDGGRDPGSITVSVMGPVLTGRDEGRYRARLEEMATARNRDPDDLEASWGEHGIPLGPPDRVRKTIARLEAIGVSKYYVQHLDLGNLDDLDETFEALAG